jgi:hypothetical protein
MRNNTEVSSQQFSKRTLAPSEWTHDVPTGHLGTKTMTKEYCQGSTQPVSLRKIALLMPQNVSVKRLVADVQQTASHHDETMFG